MSRCRIASGMLSLIFGLIVTGCSTSYYGSGPVGVFMRNPCHGCLICEHTYSGAPHHPERNYTNFVLDAGCAGKARVTLSLPKDAPSTGLPVFIVLSGLGAGEHSLQYVPDHGPYAVLSYEYPDILKEAVKVTALFKGQSIKEAISSVPGQILVISDWARKQIWSDGSPVNLIGISFGGLFVPATHHLAQAQCHELGPSVIAFSGASLYHIIYSSLDTAFPIKGVSALLATALINQLEPAAHLPYLRGEFLIVEGACDDKIPRHSRERLKCLMPEPKTVVTLDTMHIASDRPEIIEALYNVVHDWLDERHDLTH